MPEEAELTASECRSAARGCVDCKQRLAEGVIAHFAPLRERRARLRGRPPAAGRRSSPTAASGPAAVARATMELVHQAMGIG